MAEAVPFASLFKRYQLVFNSTYDLCFSAYDPTLGAGWRQVIKRIARSLNGLS